MKREGAYKRVKPFLARRIPKLNPYHALLRLDGVWYKIDTYGPHVVLVKGIIEQSY